MDEKEILIKCGFRADYDPENHTVKQTFIKYKGKIFYISTVDIGIDLRFDEGPPLYYETMVFLSKGYDIDGVDFAGLYCDRYSTKEMALLNHERIINAFKHNKITFNDGYIEFKE